MSFSRAYWERNFKVWYQSVAVSGGLLSTAHMMGYMEDFAGGNWHALRSVGVVLIFSFIATAFPGLGGLIGRGVGDNPNSPDLKGATKNGG